jgi:hypothetical protein
MFDLEQSIADWRREMLAAGIKTPVPLEELEIHLREEIERQVKSGLNEPEAFCSAVQKIGQPNLLKTEFTKSGGMVDFLRKHRTLKANCILGLVWLTFYGNFLLKMGIPTLSWVLDLKALVGVLIFWSGMVGSILLIFDSKWGRSIIRTNSLIFVAMCILTYATRFGAFSSSVGAWSFLTLCLISILLLHLPRHPKPRVAK